MPICWLRCCLPVLLVECLARVVDCRLEDASPYVVVNVRSGGLLVHAAPLAHAAHLRPCSFHVASSAGRLGAWCVCQVVLPHCVRPKGRRSFLLGSLRWFCASLAHCSLAWCGRGKLEHVVLRLALEQLHVLPSLDPAQELARLHHVVNHGDHCRPIVLHADDCHVIWDLTRWQLRESHQSTGHTRLLEVRGMHGGRSGTTESRWCCRAEVDLLEGMVCAACQLDRRRPESQGVCHLVHWRP